MPMKIVSGGQTGVDRAALDWAIQRGIPHGGWCPRGRRAEDGRIPERYRLRETPLQKYQQRTAWNVRDSDATLIIDSTDTLTGGSLLTQATATRYQRPCLHISPKGNWEAEVCMFLAKHHMYIAVLNVAGPRESIAVGMVPFVEAVLDTVLMIVMDHQVALSTLPLL